VCQIARYNAECSCHAALELAGDVVGGGFGVGPTTESFGYWYWR